MTKSPSAMGTYPQIVEATFRHPTAAALSLIPRPNTLSVRVHDKEGRIAFWTRAASLLSQRSGQLLQLLAGKTGIGFELYSVELHVFLILEQLARYRARMNILQVLERASQNANSVVVKDGRNVFRPITPKDINTLMDAAKGPHMRALKIRPSGHLLTRIDSVVASSE